MASRQLPGISANLKRLKAPNGEVAGMRDPPEVLLLHTVYSSRSHDADDELEAIEDRLGIDVHAARTPDESRELIGSAEIVVTTGRGLSPDLFGAATQLEWIQVVSSGYDGFSPQELLDSGIVLTNAGGANAEPVAEQVLGMLLCFERNIHRGIRQQFDRRWERYEAGELLEKTLGVIGVGAIGSRVAELGSAFDMRVLGIKRDPTTAPGSLDAVMGPDRLDEVLVEADYLVIACPLTPETRTMIGPDQLATMNQSAVLINVARGPIVDYDALTEALQQHQIAGAGLDVFLEEPFPPDSPLWGLSNVVMTPHMGGSTPRKPERIARAFERNYRAFVEGNLEAMPTRKV